jgi:hypothetical protein
MRQATIEAGGCYAERFRSANYIQFKNIWVLLAHNTLAKL